MFTELSRAERCGDAEALRCRARHQAFHSSSQFSEAGLRLGRGTVLAKSDGLDEDLLTHHLERIATHLSATYGSEVAPQAIRFVSRATRRSQERGETLAHIELAFTPAEAPERG